MKCKFLIAVLGAAIGVAATAAPVPALPTGPLYIKFNNLEQIATRGDTGYANEINWGVLTISDISRGLVGAGQIINPTGPAFFNNSATGQITGIFYGIESVASATSPFPATKGFMDLYYRDLPTLSFTDLGTLGVSGPGAIRTAQDKATGFTEGTLLAKLEFASGITSDPNVFINGSVVPTTLGFNAFAFSYANVIAGSGIWADQLDTSFFTTAFGQRDFTFQNSYLTQTSWNGDTTGCDPQATSGSCVLGARSTDPATAFAIPEPGSLALLGLGLLAAGAVRRRKG